MSPSRRSGPHTPKASGESSVLVVLLIVQSVPVAVVDVVDMVAVRD